MAKKKGIDIGEIIGTDRVFQLIGIAIVLALWAKFTGDKKPFITFVLVIALAFGFWVANTVIGELNKGKL